MVTGMCVLIKDYFSIVRKQRTLFQTGICIIAQAQKNKQNFPFPIASPQTLMFVILLLLAVTLEVVVTCSVFI